MKLIWRLSRKLAILTAVGTTVGVWLLTGNAGASGSQGLAPVEAGGASIEERIAGAEAVVVATARSVQARWHENEHGDRIIVSRVMLEVEENLKGAAAQMLSMDVDGGTLDDLTLQVSGLHVLEPGERAVLFLNPSAEANVHTPHMRGQGILPLDDQNAVKDMAVGLNDIRVKAQFLVK